MILKYILAVLVAEAVSAIIRFIAPRAWSWARATYVG